MTQLGSTLMTGKPCRMIQLRAFIRRIPRKFKFLFAPENKTQKQIFPPRVRAVAFCGHVRSPGAAAGLERKVMKVVSDKMTNIVLQTILEKQNDPFDDIETIRDDLTAVFAMVVSGRLIVNKLQDDANISNETKRLLYGYAEELKTVFNMLDSDLGAFLDRISDFSNTLKEKEAA
ncbi:MAG TPA: hypothetical protein VFM25_10305 [Verrucomicrobiae bacterium]|nr:hypothetical protein [Verrucomicrobiae bacterium]